MNNTIVAVFTDHLSAESAVRELHSAGFDMKNLTVVGKGYHSEEKVTGFYNTGDRVKFWGKRGAYWGGLWGLFFGGLFMTIPVVGHVVVLGYLAATAISGLESAAVVGGLSAIGAALYGAGIPKDTVLQYETALKADGFLVMARGTEEQVAQARSVLGTFSPSSLHMHAGSQSPETVDPREHATA